MENNYEVNEKAKTTRTFFRSWRFWKPFLAIVIGGLVGFLYYYFEGCSSGQCILTGNPFSSILWGSLLGLFLVKSPCSSGSCRN